jgi:hypothetical protein
MIRILDNNNLKILKQKLNLKFEEKYKLFFVLYVLLEFSNFKNI